MNGHAHAEPGDVKEAVCEARVTDMKGNDDDTLTLPSKS
jgi:hypothetical protein